MRKIRKWTWIKQPEYIGGFLVLLFGIIFMVVLRPLNTPDEANHFLRAYQIAEGDFTGRQNTKEGCLSEWKDSMNTDQALRTFFVPKSVALFAVLDRSNYDASKQYAVPLDARNQIRVCARQTSSNNPIGYIPQVIGITLGRIVHASPIVIDYLARIAVLLFWVACIFFAVRISPVRKWSLIAIALLPIAVQQSISIGADVMSIAPGILFMAVLLRSYYDDRSQYIKKDITMLCAFATVATLAKPVMIFLVLLIPFYIARKHPIMTVRPWRTKQNLITISAALVPFVFYFIWNAIASMTGVSVTDIFSLAAEKMTLLSQHPFSVLHTFMRQMYHYVVSGASLDGFGSFGWFTYIMPALWMYAGISVMIMSLTLNYETKHTITEKQRVLPYLRAIITIVAILIVIANISSLFLIWTPLNAVAIQGMQFRYYLAPLFLLAFVALGSRKNVTEVWYRNLILVNSLVLFIVTILTIAN